MDENDKFKQRLAVMNYVPFSMRDLVCTCNDWDWGIGAYSDKESQLKKKPHRCTNCHKYMRWVQRSCMRCKEKFVLTFQHPRYVAIWPTCWDCTNDESYDLWYEAAKGLGPESGVGVNYAAGVYDTWPFESADPIIPPPSEDLVRKEPVSSIEIPDDEVLFDF